MTKIPPPSTEWILARYLELPDERKKELRDYLDYLLLRQAIETIKRVVFKPPTR